MKWVLLFISGLLCGFLAAQTNAPKNPVTLGESLKMALANGAQLKKAKLDRAGLEQRLREGRSAAFPKINATVNFDYYPVLPTQYLPGQLFGLGDNTYVPAQFGQPWQLGGSINLQQPIYNESLRSGVQAMSVTRSVYDLLTNRAEEDIRFNTAQVFYQTLQTQQMLRSVNANLDKLASLQRISELQLVNGYAIPIDVKRIRVARTNLETQRQNLVTAISSLRQTLQFLCGIPFEQPFEPYEEMTNPVADSAQWQNLALETESTTEYRLLLRNLELNRIQHRSLLAQGLPSLSFYATGLYQTQRADPNIFNPNGRWFGMAVAGLKLQIPLFDGFGRQRKAGLLQIENEKLEIDRQQLMLAKNLDFHQAREQLKNALRAVQTQTDNVVLAQEITDKLMLQFKEGVAPLTDLLNAQTALSEAETNYWQQVFGYKLAVLKLLKASGHLEDLK